MTDINVPIGNGSVYKKLVDMGDGTHAEAMTLVGFAGDVTITGDAVVDTSALEALVGPLNAAKKTDPDAASATLLALLRGILHEQQLQTALMTAANSKLDDIVTNTTPSP